MELFELYLSPINATRFKAIVTQSPVGEGESSSELPFIEGEKDWRLTLIKTLESAKFNPESFPTEEEQNWMVKETILASDRNTFHPNYQANIGKALYQALFPPNSKVEKALIKSISLAEEKNTQLLIQLKIEADAVQHSRLADYPWELLHDGQRFLCHHQVGLARYIAHDTVPPSLPPAQQVNVLLISSAACDPELGLNRLSKKEQLAIYNGLEKASDAGDIRLFELPYPTLKELRAYLTQHQGNEAPQVLHFDGHGLFGQRCSNPQCRTMHKSTKREQCRACNAQLPAPQGYLVFEDEFGRPDYVSGSELGTLLHQSSLSDSPNPSRGISLCVLSACQSGMAVAGESAFNGAAQNLVSHRVPAVVAMQYSVSVESASNFAEQFYRSVGQKNSLAIAVSQGREAMGAENNQWYRPVLYLRWRDNQGGQLFATPKSAGVSPASIPSNLHLFRSGVIKFVGRNEALETLHQKLQQTERVAICAVAGMGGIGKTELALQYALHHEQQGTYPGGLCWLQAAEADIGTQFVSFAKIQLDVQIPDGLELPEQVAYCWRRWRERKGEVLLVFDDVRSYEKVQPYLPPAEPRFKVLITTRRLELGESFEQLRLEVLSENAAIELLVSFVGEERIKHEREQAKQLCQELGCLPLGLELVGRYLKRKQDLSLEKMLERLAIKHRSLQQRSQDMTGKRGVEKAFELSWDELDESAQQLGCFLSLFALAPIPWSLVEQCLPEQNQEDLEDIRDETLLNLSLLERRGQGTYQLHQLIREFFKGKLEQLASANHLKQVFCQAMVQVAKQIPESPTQDIWLEVEEIMPHVEEVAIALSDYLSEADFLIPFQGLGRLYSEGQGLYNRSEEVYLEAKKIAETRFGNTHINTIKIDINLAAIYYEQGRYREAGDLQRLLLTYSNASDFDELVRADILNGLALSLAKQGEYREADNLYKLSMQIRSDLLGDDHLDVSDSFNNLGLLYHDMGNYQEAESLSLKALNIRQKFLGENHVRVANCLNNLASCYYKQERYGDARNVYLRVLEMYRRLYGNEHREIATALNNLSVVYLEEKNFIEAESILIEVLDLQEKILGNNHPDVAVIMSNLAAVYEDLGKANQAEAVYKQALKIQRESLEPNHIDIGITLNNLAKLYQSTQRFMEADAMYLDSLRILEETLDDDHPTLNKVKSNIKELREQIKNMQGEVIDQTENDGNESN